MNKYTAMLATIFVIAGCSGSANVDSAQALPGSWNCDDGITLMLKANGKYEWHVPHDDEYSLYTESNEFIRMTDEGHALLGSWRISGDNLELDMMGETERYSLSFRSETSMRIDGPDALSCERA